MTNDLERMAEAAQKACGLALGAIGDLRARCAGAPCKEARSACYTAQVRLEAAQKILAAIDFALDIDERGHGSLRV